MGQFTHFPIETKELSEAPELQNFVPNTREVNGHALSADVTVEADEVPYSNTSSGLTATNVQDAIDSNASHIGGLGNVIGMRGWNQLVIKNSFPTTTLNGVTLTNNGDGSVTLNGTASADTVFSGSCSIPTNGHKLAYLGAPNQRYGKYILYDGYGSELVGVVGDYIKTVNHPSATIYLWVSSGVTITNERIYPQMVDLTALFGSGNEPTSVSEFRQMFGANYYPYCSGSWADLLWTNPNPSSGFGAKTVSLDLSKYSFVLVELQLSISDTDVYSAIGKVNNSYTSFSATDGYARNIRRTAKINTNGLQFSNGFYAPTYGNGGFLQNADFCVPVRIYGIR